MSSEDFKGKYDIFNQVDFGPTILVKVVEDHTGSFPQGFQKAYKCLVCLARIDNDDEDHEAAEGDNVVIVDPDSTDRYVIALNFRKNKIRKNSYMLAYKVAGVYLLDNQNTFQENT